MKGLSGGNDLWWLVGRWVTCWYSVFFIISQTSGGNFGWYLAKWQDGLHSDQESCASDWDELRGPAGESLTQTGSPFPGIQTWDWVLGVRGKSLLIQSYFTLHVWVFFVFFVFYWTPKQQLHWWPAAPWSFNLSPEVTVRIPVKTGAPFFPVFPVR